MKGEDYRTEKVEKYVEDLFVKEDQILKRVRERTADLNIPLINVSAVDGKILQTWVKAVGAKKIVEVGTLTGYSAIWMARALPAGGKLYTFEYEPKHADAARAHFREAGLADKIEIFVGDAVGNLEKINDQGPFDAIFIDADKANYINYLKWAEKHIRQGGVIMGDNTYLWGGVVRTEKPEGNEGMQWSGMTKFNAALADGSKYTSVIVPTKEGMTVAIKNF